MGKGRGSLNAAFSYLALWSPVEVSIFDKKPDSIHKTSKIIYRPAAFFLCNQINDIDRIQVFIRYANMIGSLWKIARPAILTPLTGAESIGIDFRCYRNYNLVFFHCIVWLCFMYYHFSRELFKKLGSG